VNSCPGGAGSLPTCPDGLSVFCSRSARAISATVSRNFASWSGFTQIRIA